MAQHLSGPASLEGQVALITGGAGAMGQAISKAFRQAGARVSPPTASSSKRSAAALITGATT